MPKIATSWVSNLIFHPNTTFQGDEILRMSEHTRENPLIPRDGYDSGIKQIALAVCFFH
jgi:hypothetical protein